MTVPVIIASFFAYVFQIRENRFKKDIATMFREECKLLLMRDRINSAVLLEIRTKYRGLVDPKIFNSIMGLMQAKNLNKKFIKN